MIKTNRNCDVLWNWADTELEELDDTALMKRAKKWREEIHMLATNIAPKLKATGLFPSGIQEDDIVGLRAHFIGHSRGGTIVHHPSPHIVQSTPPSFELWHSLEVEGLEPPATCFWHLDKTTTRPFIMSKILQDG